MHASGCYLFLYFFSSMNDPIAFTSVASGAPTTSGAATNVKTPMSFKKVEQESIMVPNTDGTYRPPNVKEATHPILMSTIILDKLNQIYNNSIQRVADFKLNKTDKLYSVVYHCKHEGGSRSMKVLWPYNKFFPQTLERHIRVHTACDKCFHGIVPEELVLSVSKRLRREMKAAA